MTMLALASPVSFQQPAWLWVGLLIPVLVVVSFRSMAGLNVSRRVFSLIVRSLLLLLVAACLAGMESVQRTDDVTVMFLMDRSHSVEKMLTFEEDYIKEAAKFMDDKDRLGVIDFARNAYLEQMPMEEGYFLKKLPAMPATDRTDAAKALRLAMATIPHDTTKRIVLLSDGNDNMGGLLSEARRAAADGVPIDVVPLRYQRPNEVYIDRLIVPAYAEEGEQVPLRMVLQTERAVEGSLMLFHNNQPVMNAEGGATHIRLHPGTNTFSSKIPIRESGPQRYEVRFQPDDERLDAVAVNNSATGFTIVSGPSKVLFLSSSLEYDRVLINALEGEGVQLDVRTVDQLDTFDLASMFTYSGIILANVSAAEFTDQQKEELAEYVRSHGGGLVMLGGDEGFGAGGWIGTPVEDVMPVSFEIRHKRVIPRGALVLIMHSCEVPRGNFYGKEVAKKSVDTISSQDYVGVLAFSWSGPTGNSWEVPLGLNTNKAATKSKVDRMQIGDMPDFASTMQMAYKELVSGRGRDASQRHVIILSDGDATPPSNKLLAKYKANKITVSTVAIGWGAHVMRPTMQRIATATGGKFYTARNPKALPQIFVKESKVVRRPLLVEETFQPQVYEGKSELLLDMTQTADFPPLDGMVLTSPKSDPNVRLALIRKTNDGDDPVLAYWQCELGKAVAFTSGFWPRWGQQWADWPRFATLWTQIVRWSMQQDANANFDVATKVEANRGVIAIDALDERGNFLNHLHLVANMTQPDGTARQVTLTQTKPGHYEAEFEAERAGAHLISVFDHGGRVKGAIKTGLTVPFSPEYRDLQTNEAMLREVQSITGGRWHDPDAPVESAELFAKLPPIVARKPVWDWTLGWLVLPLFLLDVSVRRLASWLALSLVVEVLLLAVLLFGLEMAYGGFWSIGAAVLLAEIVGWSIRWQYFAVIYDVLTHREAALQEAGERGAASLQQLRGTRERVRDEMTEEEEQGGLKKLAQHEIGSVSSSQRGRKFDVGDQAAEEAAGDLRESLGGAKEGETYREKQRPPAPGEQKAGEDEDATSRLLRAKRRAREGLGDQNRDRKDEPPGKQ